MFVIRNEQMKVFEESMVRSFETKLAAHLRDTQPERTTPYSEDDLFAFVRRGSKEAQNFGFVREKDISEFVEILLARGRSFADGQPSAAVLGILRDAGLKPGEKLRRLRHAETASGEPRRESVS